MVQIAKKLGATVIGTVSTEEKEKLAREAGADHIIRYTEADFEAETMRLTGGKGVPVVYDSVGKTTFDKGLNVLQPRGLMALFGQGSGPVPSFDLNILNGKGSLFVTRPSMGHYLADREELLWRSGDLFKWLAAGELSLRIDRQLPLAEAAEAHILLGRSKNRRKTVADSLKEYYMPEQLTISQVEEYLRQLYDSDDPVRHEMEALADKRSFPIIGPLAGRHLYQLAQIIGAQRVFELGSGYGYSALYFARAVGENGVVHCTELSDENIKLAENFLSRAKVWNRVTYHQEEATAALRRVGGTWDIIYNDIDKHGYPATIELAYEHLRPGGLFITDNMFRTGRVLRQEGDKSTQGVIEFTRRLFADSRFVASIYPERDGMAVALRR